MLINDLIENGVSVNSYKLKTKAMVKFGKETSYNQRLKQKVIDCQGSVEAMCRQQFLGGQIMSLKYKNKYPNNCIGIEETCDVVHVPDHYFGRVNLNLDEVDEGFRNIHYCENCNERQMRYFTEVGKWSNNYFKLY